MSIICRCPTPRPSLASRDGGAIWSASGRHDLRHSVAMEVLEQQHDLEQVRALLGHARIGTTQIYASIRPPQLKRAVSFYEEQAARMLGDANGTRTTGLVANGRSRKPLKRFRV